MRSQLIEMLLGRHMSGILPSVREMTGVRRYVSVPFLMEPGMQSETHKKATVAAFLNWTALSILMLPVACFLWALSAYPPEYACWLGFAAAIYTWPVAGILFVIGAAFHVRPASRRRENGAGLRKAHGL